MNFLHTFRSYGTVTSNFTFDFVPPLLPSIYSISDISAFQEFHQFLNASKTAHFWSLMCLQLWNLHSLPFQKFQGNNVEFLLFLRLSLQILKLQVCLLQRLQNAKNAFEQK